EGGGRARPEVRRARLPPRSAERRRRAHGRARGEDRPMDRGAQVRALLAALVLGVALAGCSREPAPADSQRGTATESRAAAKAAKAASAEAQRLRDVTEAYYEQYLQLNPLAATAQG